VATSVKEMMDEAGLAVITKTELADLRTKLARLEGIEAEKESLENLLRTIA